MAINVQSLYDSMKARFGAGAVDETFQEIYFDAWKQVKADLEIECNIDFDAPEAMVSDLDLDAKYHTVISTGLMYHISTHGQWIIEDSGNFDRRYTKAKGLAQMQSFKDTGGYGKLGDLS